MEYIILINSGYIEQRRWERIPRRKQKDKAIIDGKIKNAKSFVLITRL